MKFKPLINRQSLLLGLPIEVQVTHDAGAENRITYLKVQQPTLRILYGDSRFNTFTGILDGKLATLQLNFPLVEDLENAYSLLWSLAQTQSHESRFLLDVFKHGFGCLGLRFEPYLDFFTLEGILLTEEYFTAIKNVILISVGITEIETLNETPQEREARLKIEAIRKKDKNKQDGDGYANIEKNFMVLQYEFGMSREEILDLTPFAQKTILSYTSAAVSYKASLIAFANGGAKKIKFITDKEK